MTETASLRIQLQAVAPVEPAAAATPPQSPPKQPYTDVCNLSCRNGGVCQHPKGGGGEEEGLATGIMEPRCNCPDGYLGVLCEIKVRICVKGSSGKCMNDQTCIPEYNGQFHHCECDPDVFAETVAGENGKYNLQFCQSVVTTWCDGGGAVTSNSNREDVHYCYNAGKCKSMRRGGSYTCDCPPGWSGAHCATPTDMAAAASGQDGGGGIGIGGRVMRFLLVTTLVFTVLMLCAIGCLIQYGQVKSRRRKRNARRRNRERQLRRKKGGHRRLRQRRSNGDDGDNNEGIEMSEMGNTSDAGSDEESESSSSSNSAAAESGSDASGSDDEEDSDDEFEDEPKSRKRQTQRSQY
jgi:EGF-like domain